MSDYVAYCWRNGPIQIGRSVPFFAIGMIRGTRHRLRKTICATSRHAYDGKTKLVPGLPEAEDDDAAIRAVCAYAHWAAGHDRHLTTLVSTPAEVV